MTASRTTRGTANDSAVATTSPHTDRHTVMRATPATRNVRTCRARATNITSPARNTENTASMFQFVLSITV
jgi:hypothetical protein